MKTLITPNILKFILTTLILTITFRVGLSTSIANKMTIAVIMSSAGYGILMWFNGRYFGIKEHEYLPIYDIGFRFHFATFLVHNSVSVLWFVFGFASHYEHIEVTYMIALIWSVFLITHFCYFLYMRKSSIKNLNKDDLFE